MTHSKIKPPDFQPLLSVISFLTKRSQSSPARPVVNGDTVWEDKEPFIRHMFPDSDRNADGIGNLRDMIGILRDAANGLASVEKFIESGIKHLENQLKNRLRSGRGLDVLPDEVLMHIFEHAFESVEVSEEETTRPIIFAPSIGNILVRVNRRLRSIALSTPTLWTIVTSWQTKEALNAHLLRSKTAGLHVYLYSMSESDDTSEKYAGTEHIVALLSHAWRWESLYINSVWESYYPKSSKLLYKTQRGLELPALRSLSLKALFGEKAAKFITSLVMPNLACLTIEDMNPTPFFGSSLTECEIILSGLFVVIDVPCTPYDRLVKFLGSLHRLKKLKMTFSGFDTDFANPALEQKLPTLTILEFERDATVNPILQLMRQVLRTPNIQKLGVTVTEKDTNEPFWFLSYDCLPVRPEECTSLKELSFCHRDVPHFPSSGTIHCLVDLLTRLPQIELLTVKAVPYDNQEESCKSSNTHVVRSEGCNALEALRALQRPAAYSGIESLEILEGRGFSKCTVHFKEICVEDAAPIDLLELENTSAH